MAENYSKRMVKLAEVLTPPKLIELLWPQVWPLIEPAVQLETEQDVLNELMSAARFLLVVGDGVAIVRNCGTFFEINYVGGDKAKDWWPQMSEHITAMAKAFGCQKIIAFGRPAWKKLAPDFKPTETRMYIKEVA